MQPFPKTLEIFQLAWLPHDGATNSRQSEATLGAVSFWKGDHLGSHFSKRLH